MQSCFLKFRQIAQRQPYFKRSIIIIIIICVLYVPKQFVRSEPIKLNYTSGLL